MFYLIFLLCPLLVFFLTRRQSKVNVLLNVIIILTYSFGTFKAISWIDLGSYYFRYATILLALIVAFRLITQTPKLSSKTKISSAIFQVIVILISSFFLFLTYQNNLKLEQSIDLKFPLKGGTYYISQGGKNRILNYHLTLMSDKYHAVDITRMNHWGRATKSLFSSRNNQYLIFGDSVFSPVSGKVIYVKNLEPDHQPGSLKGFNDEKANVVVIKTNEAEITLAHFKNNSILVKKDSILKVGDFLGLVGNSGKSNSPHLHIHASNNHEAIPIKFDNKSLIKNDVVFK